MRSEQINELAKALNAVQSVLEGAKKDSTNPFFKSKYADLESVWEAARPLLAPNGLSVAQTMGYLYGDGAPPTTTLITTLMHNSGQYISGEMPLVLKQHDPQGQGSAITYARRYCLAAILGIHQTDDDAEDAKGGNHQQVHKPTVPLLKAAASPKPSLPTPPSEEKVTPIQMNQLLMVGKGNGWTREQISDFVCKYFKMTPKAVASGITLKQWELTKAMISNPLNANGEITVTADGAELFESLPA